MKKLFKTPLFYITYILPQLILVHAVTTFNLDFINGKSCVSDYFLYFFDWTVWDIFCMYEVVYVTILLVIHIRKELISNRIILYESKYKLWLKVIKSSIAITFIIPIINCLIFSIVARIKNVGWDCNWNEFGSMAEAMIPYYELHEIKTIWIIIISVILDVLRLQLTMFIVCIVDWLIRKAVLDYVVIYTFVIFTNLNGLFDLYDIPIKSFYNYMHLSQRGVYLRGINVIADIGIPIIIWSIGLIGSFLIFKYYRKDMLKD